MRVGQEEGLGARGLFLAATNRVQPPSRCSNPLRKAPTWDAAGSPPPPHQGLVCPADQRRRGPRRARGHTGWARPTAPPWRRASPAGAPGRAPGSRPAAPARPWPFPLGRGSSEERRRPAQLVGCVVTAARRIPGAGRPPGVLGTSGPRLGPRPADRARAAAPSAHKKERRRGSRPNGRWSFKDLGETPAGATTRTPGSVGAAGVGGGRPLVDDAEPRIGLFARTGLPAVECRWRRCPSSGSS